MAKKSFFAFLQDQRKGMPPVVKVDLSGKTVIVVGANTGLGFQATKHFATMNPGRLILACRSEERGQAALESMSFRPGKICKAEFCTVGLKKETDYQKAELWLVDLSRFSSVTAFANKYEADGGRLDILVLNAGVIPDWEYRTTVDGWESSYVSSYMGPYHPVSCFIQVANQRHRIAFACIASASSHVAHG